MHHDRVLGQSPSSWRGIRMVGRRAGASALNMNINAKEES
jgi:hypothetical protein